MVAVKFSPVGNGVNWIPNTGLIANGYKLFFYTAGTTAKLDTYTTSAGSIANSNPVVLDTYGFPSNGGNRVQIWLQEGESYKVVIASGSDTDPPASGITLADGITGINDIQDLVSEWLLYSAAPTYVSSTSFTVVGNQTALFHVGRRVKSTVSGGTAYSTITATSYSAPDTTVTVVNDSTALDAGLSVVYYGLLSGSGSGPSIPKFAAPDGSTAVTQTAGDSSTKLATTAFVDNARDLTINEFRLTLTTGVPVTTSDVTSATTIYWTPYIGNRISLWSGTAWQVYTSAELSLAIGTVTTQIGHDIFVYLNAGVPTLERVAWTNSSTRATALTTQNGILVKSGDATRRYVGSFLGTSTTQTEDSVGRRYLFNYYNRVTRSCGRVIDVGLGASWTYTTATWRASGGGLVTIPSGGSACPRWFVGVVEDAVSVSINAMSSNSTASIERRSAYGLNTTTAPSGGSALYSGAGGVITTGTVGGSHVPALGYNYVAPLEYSEATGTTTWYGDVGTSGWATIRC